MGHLLVVLESPASLTPETVRCPEEYFRCGERHGSGRESGPENIWFGRAIYDLPSLTCNYQVSRSETLMNPTPPRWLLVGNATKSPVNEKVVLSVQISTSLCRYLFCANTSANIHVLDLRRESPIQDQFSLFITSQGLGWNRRVELSFDARDVLSKSEQHSMLNEYLFFIPSSDAFAVFRRVHDRIEVILDISPSTVSRCIISSCVFDQRITGVGLINTHHR